MILSIRKATSTDLRLHCQYVRYVYYLAELVSLVSESRASFAGLFALVYFCDFLVLSVVSHLHIQFCHSFIMILVFSVVCHLHIVLPQIYHDSSVLGRQSFIYSLYSFVIILLFSLVISIVLPQFTQFYHYSIVFGSHFHSFAIVYLIFVLVLVFSVVSH